MNISLRSTVNSQPVGRLSKEDAIKLKHEWRNKLRDSGFKDIEKWSNIDKQIPGFLYKGHVHWEYYKTEANYRECELEYNNYFKVLSTYLYNFKKFPKKYFNITEDYLLTGNLKKSVEKVNPKIKVNTIRKYLLRNYKKMVTFVIAFDRHEDIKELKCR